MSRVYVDFDDVLAQTALSFTRLLEQSYDKRVALEEITHFDLSRSFDMSRDELEDFMREAHRSERLMAIEPMEGAIETLSVWAAHGWEIEVLTGRPPAADQATRDWLAKHRVPHAGLYFVDKYARYDESAWDGHSPVLRLEEVADHDYDLIVEDSLETAVRLAATTDAEIVLLDRPWNRDLEGVDHRTAARLGRYSDWHEIARRAPMA